jgi:hypothetical protein
MRSHLILSLVLTFLSSLALAVQSREVTLLAWPLSAPKPQTLAQVSFTSTNASIKSYTPPTIPAGDDVIRLGFHHQPSGQWSGIATSASNFHSDSKLSKTIQLHVRSDGELYHLGLKIAEQGKGSARKDELVVEVAQIQKGPVPALNKPVVVSADGEEAKEPEKSFLQKYVA